MCCSVTPDVEVLFSDTILYAAEVIDQRGKLVHTLGYQNTAQNNVNANSTKIKINNSPEIQITGLWNKLRKIFTLQNIQTTRQTANTSTGNAMLLPFPALAKTMTKENILDTKECPNILKDIAVAVKPLESVSFGASARTLNFQAQSIQIFEAAGIYTVVLAQDINDIPNALKQVPIEKRPVLNPELFEAFAKWYPNWTFALCCFNNEQAKEALPMLWWYEPMFSEKLFLPALDSHTGDVPKLLDEVKIDHSIAVGSIFAIANSPLQKSDQKCRKCTLVNAEHSAHCFNCGSTIAQKAGISDAYNKVSYKNHVSSAIKTFLLPQVMGKIYNEVLPNGDFVCELDDVRQGIWNPIRCLPPHF